MKNPVNALLLSAALTGLVGGTTVATAQTADNSTPSSVKTSVKAAKAGYRLAGFDKVEKHSCKGKNSCKGKGGCGSGDNGCKGKNSCKGKGGCATDGSPMPKLS